MRFFQLERVAPSRVDYDIRTEPKWGLPGLHCPTCDETWSGVGEAYPAVDLSDLDDRRKFKARVEEDFAEFTRLRERVRPLVPEGVPLEPGTTFGPLAGSGRGHFPELVFPTLWTLLVRRESLEQLQAEGLHGLMGCRTELRIRGSNPPELLELQLEPRGLLHPDCLPRNLPAPCATCGQLAFTFPQAPILDAASLPTDRDVFRLGSYSTILVGTERFAETVRRLGFEGVEFQELPTR
ncbi:SitI6 family double-CXXCG motif immunity protein [Pyxidicoccus xibeiensis]|uniref:SitI6 family double-CXXCG motif immunity protein n=1 Tax=Pyxidicoccus xibeiensis TaxID=2906759 RepID=UPI0020A78D81|nr:double-CXXCG motif protein [Pyxidicoccus xibeiensis]MCP3145219.1 double-CXXCG motif protein [Pyxidicoccus xibeiensis]